MTYAIQIIACSALALVGASLAASSGMAREEEQEGWGYLFLTGLAFIALAILVRP